MLHLDRIARAAIGRSGDEAAIPPVIGKCTLSDAELTIPSVRTNSF